jgi:hypothetical protein
MRVPIQRSNEKFIATIDWEEAPPGFEDAFEQSLFYRRYQESRAYGEYLPPDVTALTGNPTAQHVRLHSIEENRVCLNLLHIGVFHGRYFQMEVKPYGPLANALYRALNSNFSCYLEFRTRTEEDEDGVLVKNILGADFYFE